MKTVTLWFVSGRTWSYTCPATEAQYFLAYASQGEADNHDPNSATYSGGIYQPPSAPGRYIVWRNLTDFQIT